MTTTDTIKALRDALTQMVSITDESWAEQMLMARTALTLTADASEDAPAKLDRKVIMEKVLSKEGMRRYRNGDSLNLDPTDLDEIAILAFEQVAARPAPVAATPALVCAMCKADRLKEPCRGLHSLTCPFTGVASVDGAALVSTAPAAPIAEVTGTMCPARDVECGDSRQAWCATCPKWFPGVAKAGAADGAGI